MKVNTERAYYFFILQDITTSLHKPQMKRRHKRKLSAAHHLVAHTKQGYSQTYQVKNNMTQQTQIEDNPDLWYLNPRFNFSDALADINKRLLSQTSFWIRLWASYYIAYSKPGE